MPIEKVLIEYAKVQLQLIVANEQIAQLQAQLKSLQTTQGQAVNASEQQ